MTRKAILLLFAIFCLNLSHSVAYGWDGFDYTTGNHISIESYDHGGNGEGEVEYFDYSTGTYKSGYLDMYPGGSGTLMDYETGEYRDVQMD